MHCLKRIWFATVVGLPLSFGGRPLSLAAESNPRLQRPTEISFFEAEYLRVRDGLVSGPMQAREPRRGADLDRAPVSGSSRLPAVEPIDASGARRLARHLPSDLPAVLPRENDEDDTSAIPHAEPVTDRDGLRSVLKHLQESNSDAGPNPAIANVTAQAHELARHGMSLAGRGAYFSARSEFIQALRLVAQALDQESTTAEHCHQLAAGLRALEEAKDFIPPGSQLEADMDLASLVATHQTPMLKHVDLTQTTALAALQDYYTYSQEQLAAASGHEPAASLALFGLGKIHLLLAGQTTTTRRLDQPKAMVFHRAALWVDPANYRAANELGVLLARCGQLEQAKQVLQQSALTAPQPEAWHNLAVVHERLGETSQAQQARQEWQLLSSGGATMSRTPASDAPVQWLDAKQFARMSAGQEQEYRPATNDPPQGQAAPGGKPVTQLPQPQPYMSSSGRPNPPPPWRRPTWQAGRPNSSWER